MATNHLCRRNLQFLQLLRDGKTSTQRSFYMEGSNFYFSGPTDTAILHFHLI